jgi:hypothetical protein
MRIGKKSMSLMLAAHFIAFTSLKATKSQQEAVKNHPKP